MSLIANSQKDTDVKAGEGLLDDMVDHMITYYRKHRNNQPVMR